MPGSPRSSPASRRRTWRALVHDGLARHGYSRRGQHVGYGIGLGYPPTWIDNLRIKETDPHVLQEGMTFLFHAGLLAPEGDVYVALGDPVLVTAGRARAAHAAARAS